MSLLTVELLREVIPPTSKEITELKLDFKNILRIDNLWRLTNLAKLQLENNQIEKIEGFELLVNLTWIDLSYNKIKEIEGLNSLKSLRTLSLKSNRISILKNMDNLIQLELFSIGYNNIESYDQLIYLRKFKNLNCLVFEGNPLIDEEDDEINNYQKQVLVRLPFLEYLDYEIVTQSMVQSSRDKYGWKMKDVEEMEERDRLRDKISAEAQEKFESYRAAFIAELYENRFCESILLPYKNIFRSEDTVFKQVVERINELSLKQTEIALDSHQRRLKFLRDFERACATINAQTCNEIQREVKYLPVESEKLQFWMKLNEIEAARGDKIKVLTTSLLKSLFENLSEFAEHIATYISSISENTEVLNQQAIGLFVDKETQGDSDFSCTQESINELNSIINSRADNWFEGLSNQLKWKEYRQNRENVAMFLR